VKNEEGKIVPFFTEIGSGLSYSGAETISWQFPVAGQPHYATLAMKGDAQVLVNFHNAYYGEILKPKGAEVSVKFAIEPRYGYWTLPGGFMEINETLANGAVRETIEETNAKVAIIDLFTVFDSCSSNNISFFYRARLDSPEFSATSESLEVRLFAEEEIPWEQLSFQTVRLTLQAFFDDRKKASFTVHRFSI
jgi:ADP-ribose pyrophosphatase YjhB (NUDIX family)